MNLADFFAKPLTPRLSDGVNDGENGGVNALGEAPEDADVNIETDVRHNLKNGKGEPDTKPWRFYRA